MPVLTTSSRSAVLIIALAAATLSLVAASTPRLVGDAGEYLAMSRNLAHLSPPGLSDADLARAATNSRTNEGAQLVMASYRGRDGRQDFPHFWMYSLLAAPSVRAAEALAINPLIGFTALNIVLFLGASALMSSRAPPAATLLVAAGPILWWIDKAHTEVFTYSLSIVAVVLLREAPWWSIAAFGLAATQNPPFVGAMIVAIGAAVSTHGWGDRRVWLGAGVGIAIALAHPVYYRWHLGIWSGLATGIAQHVPSLRELTTVLFDLNLGIFVHDPWFALAIVLSAWMWWRRRPRPFDTTDGAVSLIAALFLVSFSQTANINSGGTPNPSRYGLWLLPLAVPLVGSVADEARSIKWVAAGSVVWCAINFAPQQPEQHLRPSGLARAIWQRWPSIDNPIAEVFAERVAGMEPSSRPPISTPGCEKLLLVGRAGDPEWPIRCTPAPAPSECRAANSLCYANRDGFSYRFATAPSSPGWLAGAIAPSAAADDLLTLTYRRSELRHQDQAVAWAGDGWSYLERDDAVASRDWSRWRWMADAAQFGVTTLSPATVRMTIGMRSFDRPRRINVRSGSADIAILTVAPQHAEYEVAPFQLRPGRTMITLVSLDGAEAPSTDDGRRLSVALFHARLIVEN